MRYEDADFLQELARFAARHAARLERGGSEALVCCSDELRGHLEEARLAGNRQRVRLYSQALRIVDAEVRRALPPLSC